MSTLKITTDGKTIVIPVSKRSVITLDGIKIVVNKNLKITKVSESNSIEKFLEHNGYVGLDSGFGIEVKQIRMFSRDIRSDYNYYCMENETIPVSKTEFLSAIKYFGFRPASILRIGEKVSNGFIFYKKIV